MRLSPAKKIKIDRFFEIPIKVEGHEVMVGDTTLTINGGCG